MPVTWIEHKGKKILHTDYRNVTDEGEILALLKEATNIIRETPGKIRFLADFRNTNVPSNFMTEVKKNGKNLFKEKAERHAILGVTGIKKVLLKAYVVFSGENIKPFDSEKDAKDYLAA